VSRANALRQEECKSGLFDVDLTPKQRLADAGENLRVEVHRHRDDLTAKDRLDTGGRFAPNDEVDRGRCVEDDQSR
jgi:hypothetical protein